MKMAKKIKHQYNIDYLKLCLNTPPEFFTDLSQQMDGAPIFYPNFFLMITDNGRGKENDKTPIKILADLFLDEETEEGKNLKMGTFTFFNTAKYDGRSFFEFDNEILYKPLTERMGYVSCINYILNTMGVEINNITKIDISLDTTRNVERDILTKIKDKPTEMIYKGRVVQEDEILEDFGEYFQRKRAKRERNATLYFQHKKADGLAMKVYNKSREIEQKSGKEYINESNAFGKAQTHRVEISVKNEEFKKFLTHLVADGGATPEQIECITNYQLSTIINILPLLFSYTTEKLLYFRSNGRKLTLTDIATGEVA
jgi:hypothetical protein